MSAPFTELIGVRQLRIARPLTMAVHEPHWPSPHPNFGPLSARSSLRTYNSGVVGSTSTVWDCPFTFRVKTLIVETPVGAEVSHNRGFSARWELRRADRAEVVAGRRARRRIELSAQP